MISNLNLTAMVLFILLNNKIALTMLCPVAKISLLVLSLLPQSNLSLI